MPASIISLRSQFTSGAFFSFCWCSLFFFCPWHWGWHPRLSGQDWHPPGPCCCSQALLKCMCPCVLPPESAHSHAQPESLPVRSCLRATSLWSLDHCCPDRVRVSEPETWEVQLPVGSRRLGPGRLVVLEDLLGETRAGRNLPHGSWSFSYMVCCVTVTSWWKM